MIVTMDEFFNVIYSEINKIKEALPDIKNAAVVELTRDGKPIIQFDEDSLPSQKIYPHFSSFAPVVGMRVMLINGIITGGWTP